MSALSLSPPSLPPLSPLLSPLLFVIFIELVSFEDLKIEWISPKIMISDAKKKAKEKDLNRQYLVSLNCDVLNWTWNRIWIWIWAWIWK